MNIEPLILVAGPIGSIAMIIWLSLLFAKSQNLKRTRAIAYKIWAVVVIVIFTAVLISGLAWRLHEGSASVKIWVLTFVGIGAAFLWVKVLWDLLIERK
jgi:chromate transport protein ChrA